MVLLRLLLLGSTEHQPSLIQMKGMTDRPIKSVSKQALRHRAAVMWLFFLIPLSCKHYLIAVPSSLWIQHSQKDLQCIAPKSTQSSHMTQAHTEAKKKKKIPIRENLLLLYLFLAFSAAKDYFWMLGKAQVFRKLLLSSPLGSSILSLNHHKIFLSFTECPHIYTHCLGNSPINIFSAFL